MSFDFFNPSHLAFGSKLTKAFNQLNRLALDAEDALDDLRRVYDVYTQYVNRNYPCPVPSRPDAPCRTNEIFDLINDVQTIKELKIGEDNKLHCAINIFKRNTNRITVATGETELKHGFIYCTPSISNQRPERELQFVEDTLDGVGNFIAEFRVDSDNNISIIGDSSSYFLPGNFDHVTGMEYEEDITFEDGKYTATDNECIVCIGHGGTGIAFQQLRVNLNGEDVFLVNSRNLKNFSVMYLKPGDVLSGNMTRAFKVKYTKNIVPVPTPIEPGVITAEAIKPPNCISMSNLEGSPESFIGGGTYKARCVEPGTNVNFGYTPIVKIYCTNWNSIKSITFTADAAKQIGTVAPIHTPIDAILHFNDSTTETISSVTITRTINLLSYNNLNYIELKSTGLGSLASAGECYALYEDFSYESR